MLNIEHFSKNLQNLKNPSNLSILVKWLKMTNTFDKSFQNNFKFVKKLKIMIIIIISLLLFLEILIGWFFSGNFIGVFVQSGEKCIKLSF